MIISNLPIGVLDSGIGGLSTLAVLNKVLPYENFIFYADHKNAPYGDKSKKEVEAFVYDIIKFFVSQNVKAVVIACNTAVSVAIKRLRKEFNIPILGLEPAVKLAYDNCKEKDLLIMATKLTINGEKLKDLLNKLDIEKRVKKISASGLVELIENKDDVNFYLKNLLNNINKKKYSYLVLGCTHYIFVKKEIEMVIGKDIRLIDGNMGISLHLKNILEENDIKNLNNNKGKIQLITSGNNNDYEKLEYFYQKALNLE